MDNNDCTTSLDRLVNRPAQHRGSSVLGGLRRLGVAGLGGLVVRRCCVRRSRLGWVVACLFVVYGDALSRLGCDGMSVCRRVVSRAMSCLGVGGITIVRHAVLLLMIFIIGPLLGTRAVARAGSARGSRR